MRSVLLAAAVLSLTGAAFAQINSVIDVTQPPLSTVSNHSQYTDQPGWTHYSGGGTSWGNGGLGWSPVMPMVGTASDTSNKPWAPTGQNINFGHIAQVNESIYSLPANTSQATISGTFNLWGFNSNQPNGGPSMLGLGLGNGVNVSIEPVQSDHWNIDQKIHNWAGATDPVQTIAGSMAPGNGYFQGDGNFHWMAVLHDSASANPVALMDLGTWATGGSDVSHGDTAGWHTASLTLKDNGNGTDDVTVVFDGVSHTLAGIGQLGNETAYPNANPLLLNQATFGLGSAEQRDTQSGTFASFTYVSVTPEPATLSLLGLGAVALLRRRR
jgi:hypothetical protein